MESGDPTGKGAEADLVIYGANIITMDEGAPSAEAVAARGGRIIRIGGDGEVLELVGGETVVIEGDGRAVLPGFIDCHVHLMMSGLACYETDVSGCRSIREMLHAIEVRAAGAERGEWIHVGGFDDTRVVERRYPHIEELDGVAPENPLIFKRVDGHSCVLNSMALRVLGLPEDLEGFERDPETGRLTGVLRQQANYAARKKVDDLIPDALRIEGLYKVAGAAAARGVTTIHALDGGVGDFKPLSIILEQVERLPVRVVPYYQTTDVGEVERLGFPRIGGCLLLDGSMDSHTAALHEPYADKPSTRGALYFRDEELEAFIESAHGKGLQIAVHAIGDRAVDQLLDIYERVLSRHPREDHRHRIEHIEVPTEEQVRRCRELGIALSVQPAFLYYWDMDFYRSRLGEPRAERIHPYRSIVSRGIIVGGGSDSPVTPINPIIGIHAAVNHPVASSAVDVMEAIRMFTAGAAKIAFEEDLKGSLEVGKYADMVILSDNPTRVKKEKIKEIKVEATIIGGKISYNSKEIEDKIQKKG